MSSTTGSPSRVTASPNGDRPGTIRTLPAAPGYSGRATSSMQWRPGSPWTGFQSSHGETARRSRRAVVITGEIYTIGHGDFLFERGDAETRRAANCEGLRGAQP